MLKICPLLCPLCPFVTRMSALSHNWAIEMRAVADELERRHLASLYLSRSSDSAPYILTYVVCWRWYNFSVTSRTCSSTNCASLCSTAAYWYMSRWPPNLLDSNKFLLSSNKSNATLLRVQIQFKYAKAISRALLKSKDQRSRSVGLYSGIENVWNRNTGHLTTLAPKTNCKWLQWMHFTGADSAFEKSISRRIFHSIFYRYTEGM